MTRNRTYRLGDLQLQIMKILWKSGPLGVAEVHGQLKGQPLAYTTVATMLRKMEVRQLVQHRQEGRRFVYEAMVDSQEVTRSMATDLVDRLFAGSLTDAMSHLLETRDVSRRELVRLEQLIEERKRRT
jgi:BlaI family transcriptional regulator, penicillinase repressor